jgi:hypothetical protein
MSAPRDVLTDVKDAARDAADRVEHVMDREIDAYAAGHERPLRGYGAFIAAYGAVVGAAVLYGRKRGVKLPDRVGLSDLALLSVATHRVSRLISKDSITSVVRAPFARYVEPAGAGEVNEEVRGSGIRHAFGELIECPFCLAQWVGTAFVGGLVFAPRATRVVASTFSVIAVADWLQFGYAKLQQSE